MRLSPLCFIPLGLATLVGCTEPVPPTPRGAWTVSFRDPGIDCAQAGHNATVGSVTSNKKDAVITDGAEGADVKCTVSAATGGFNVDASMSQKDKFLLISVDGVPATATEEAPAHGALSYSSVNTIKSYTSSSDTPCNFYFIPETGEGIAAGKVWFAFQCPEIVAEGSTCEIQQGYAIFENCTEGVVE